MLGSQFGANVQSVPVTAEREARLPIELPSSGLVPPVLFVSVPKNVKDWALITPLSARITAVNATLSGFRWERMAVGGEPRLPGPLGDGDLWTISPPMEAPRGVYTLVATASSGTLAATYISVTPPGVEVEVVEPWISVDSKVPFTGDPVTITVAPPDPSAAIEGEITAPDGTRTVFTGARVQYTPARPGDYYISAKVGGQRRRGGRSLHVHARGVRFLGFSDRPIDANGDGLIEGVDVRFRFDVVIPGKHHLLARFHTSAGEVLQRRAILDWRSGPREFTVALTDEDLVRAKVDGPLTIGVLHVTREDPAEGPALAGTWDNLGRTRAYARTSIDRGNFYIDGEPELSAIDANADARIDSLRLTVAAVTPGGMCSWTAELISPSGQGLQRIQTHATLPRGRSEIKFDFSGARIQRRGESGVFKAGSVNIYCGRAEVSHRGMVQSRFYTPDQFESAPESIRLVVPAQVTAAANGAIRFPAKVQTEGGFDGEVTIAVTGLPPDFPPAPRGYTKGGGEVEMGFHVPKYNEGGKWLLQLTAVAEQANLRAAASIELVIPARDIPALRAREAAAKQQMEAAFLKATAANTGRAKDVVLILDRSGSLSMARGCLPLRAAARAFAATLRPRQDALGVILFSSKVLVESPLATEFTAVSVFGDGQRCEGYSDTLEALRQARLEVAKGRAAGAAPHVVLFADGPPALAPKFTQGRMERPSPESVREQMEASVREASEMNAPVHVIALGGDDGARAWFKRLATGQLVQAESAEAIEAAFAEMALRLATLR